ncbi:MULTISPECIES: tetratricopeptide repeat protein [unclassified Myroides]|uniref:tetratricopeptide repeat protein n=1 Tax=unclassified Myroides TaxID=2642485 RepID=UPI0015FCB1C4|nr:MULTISPECIES: tetratricopeptide repeat protein [unclassified Myroides]MBB1150490.1 tetratricopeptide repeat protein [Myroides sp. NP-2]MDM1407460.1 tetratricopeptide repeat protein [Myroides sp. DF42-4-2]
MNKKYVYLAAALLISGLTMAQKKELKDAEKAVKKGNVAEATTALKAVEGVLGQATNDQKIQYYYLKSNLAYQQIEKNQNFDANVDEMVAAYKAIESIDKNNKFAKQANEELGIVASKVINKAIEDNNSKNYIGATKKFKQAFDINPKDTLYLYYAASTAISSKDYKTATTYYKELIDLGYNGNESYYTAVDKATGEVQNFGKDSKMRDVLVKQGSHVDPKFVKEDSKRPEIIKNLALIYYQEGQYEEAEKAVIEARKSNPDDTNLMLTQMDLYLKSNNIGKYEEVAKEALAKNPNDDVLLYNLGVTSFQAGKVDDARKYYEQAIRINPKNESAYLNMAFLKLQPDEEITNKMNSLGMSAADNKKYDQLQKEKKALYRDAMNDLEKVLAINPSNEEAINTLKNIYRALEMNDKLKALESR